MPLTLTPPDELTQCHVKSWPEVITNSAGSIFKLDHELIKQILENKNTTLLSKIREPLVNKFEEINPNYKANLARTRNVKHDPKDVFEITLSGCPVIGFLPVPPISLCCPGPTTSARASKIDSNLEQYYKK